MRIKNSRLILNGYISPSSTYNNYKFFTKPENLVGILEVKTHKKEFFSFKLEHAPSPAISRLPDYPLSAPTRIQQWWLYSPVFPVFKVKTTRQFALWPQFSVILRGLADFHFLKPLFLWQLEWQLLSFLHVKKLEALSSLSSVHKGI